MATLKNMTKNQKSVLLSFYKDKSIFRINLTEPGPLSFYWLAEAPTISKIICEFRQVNCLSLAKFGDLIGLTAPSCFHLERGGRPTNKTISKISKITGMSVFRLLEIRAADDMRKDVKNIFKK